MSVSCWSYCMLHGFRLSEFSDAVTMEILFLWRKRRDMNMTHILSCCIAFLLITPSRQINEQTNTAEHSGQFKEPPRARVLRYWAVTEMPLSSSQSLMIAPLRGGYRCEYWFPLEAVQVNTHPAERSRPALKQKTILRPSVILSGRLWLCPDWSLLCERFAFPIGRLGAFLGPHKQAAFQNLLTHTEIDGSILWFIIHSSDHDGRVHGK